MIGFVVGGGDDEGVIGILKEHVPHTLNLGGFQEDIKRITSERMRKWAEQVRRAIEMLHKIGVL